MGTDFDPLDDLFADVAVKPARQAGKFQPKRKPGLPKKGPVASTVSSLTAIQTSDTTQSELNEPEGAVKPSEPHDSNSVSPLCKKNPTTNDTGQASVELLSNSDVVARKNRGWHDDMEKSMGENADLYMGLEALNDLLPHGSTDVEGTGPPSDLVHLSAPNPDSVQGGFSIPVSSPLNDLTNMSNTSGVPMSPILFEEADLLTTEQPMRSRGEAGLCMDGRELEREELDVMNSIDFSDLITKPVQRTGKFQPKPKVKLPKDGCVSSKYVSDPLGLQPLPPEINSAAVPAPMQDDFSSITDNIPIEATLNKESENHTEIPLLDSDIGLEGVPEFPAKLASRRAKTVGNRYNMSSDPSPHPQKACTSGEENVTGRVLRPRKSKTRDCEVDDDEDVLSASSVSRDECQVSSAAEEDNNLDEQFHEESELKEQKVGRKSKKTNGNKEKPGKKRKKAKETTDQGAEPKPKRFPHATRRRRVDKVLLETPEDEIDYQKVPLRDLILLAEHKERHTKKEAAAAKLASKQSNGNCSASHNENETSIQDGAHDDGQASPIIEEDNVCVNYQTYMVKVPTQRWSKQETELFYEGVQQFGTDLSMIRHLFPDRKPKQIKLKYKKEERQHPLRLREALSSRAKNLSHFNLVIKRLKEKAAKENMEAGKDESADLTGDEAVEEGTTHVDDEGAENEQNGEEENEDPATERAEEGGSTMKEDDDDGEDELFLWSQYKSDT